VLTFFSSTYFANNLGGQDLNDSNGEDSMYTTKNFMAAFISFPKPIFVAVNGSCVGIGKWTENEVYTTDSSRLHLSRPKSLTSIKRYILNQFCLL
jgi:hypothetical protein